MNFVAIPGYEGRYAISEEGRVLSFMRGNPRELKPVVQNGYRCITLRDCAGRRRAHGIHRLLLTTFVRTPQEGEQARHLNDDRLDNRLENLAWGSQFDNAADAITNGKNPWRNRTHCPSGHPYSADNTYVSGGHRKCATCVADRGRTYREATPRARATCLDCGASMRADYLRKHQSRVHPDYRQEWKP